jgi:hypothetical protein
MREAGATSTGEVAVVTGGSHGRTARSLAQRLRGYMRRPRQYRRETGAAKGIIEAETP